MSNQMNFYEEEGVTYEFDGDSENIIHIYSANNEDTQLFTRDFSPLFYNISYEDGEYNPSITPENLYDIHHLAKEGLEYDNSHILNHTWIDNIKTMILWTPGDEVYFQALPDGDNIIIVIYSEHIGCNHKIDVDGFLCARIPIPNTRRHLHTDHHVLTEYQRVVCLYNINLEDNQQPYILK